MSTTEIRAMQLQKQRSVIFFCKDCKESFVKIPLLLNKITLLDNEVSSLKGEISSLKEEVTSLTVEIDNLKQQQQHCTQNLAHGSEPGPIDIQSNPEDMLREFQERNSRAYNIIVFKIKESNANTLEDKIAHDKQIAKQMMEVAGVHENHLKKVVRLGKAYPNKCRPLRLIFDCPDIRHSVIKQKRRLLDLGFPVSFDKTKMQQEVHKETFLELKRRLDQGEKDLVMIYRNDKPKIVVSKKSASKNE